MSDYEKVFNEEENYFIFDNKKIMIVYDRQEKLIYKTNKSEGIFDEVYLPLNVDEFKMLAEVVL